MTSETFTKEQLWAELETLGEDKVREKLAVGAYGIGPKRALAEEWLRHKERLRSEVSNREQISAARSAKNAAWAAAIAAIAAAIVAIISILS